MRPSEHLAWKPTPHATYHAFCGIPPEANALGFVLMRVESGRVPCAGPDTDPDDNYAGAVLTRDGMPLKDERVCYYRAKPDAAPTAQDRYELAGEARTTAQGKHLLFLAPGEYHWHYESPAGAPYVQDELAPLAPVTARLYSQFIVAPGHQIEWESIAAPATDDAPEVVTTGRKELCVVVEDLLLDWHDEDGAKWDWHEAQETLINLCRRIPGLRQVGFARPPADGFVTELRRAGINAPDVRWRDVEWAMAYRNFNAVLKARFLRLQASVDPDGQDRPAAERANFQMKRAVSFTGEDRRKIELKDGYRRYLHDARCGAVYFAAQEAALHGPPRPGTKRFFNLNELGASEGRTAQDYLAEFENQGIKVAMPPGSW